MSDNTSTAMIIIDGKSETEVQVKRNGRNNWVADEIAKVLGRKDFYVRSNKVGGMNVVDLSTGHRIGAIYWIN
jgi:hypothetical protein